MKPAQLLYEHYRLVERERVLRDDIERVTARLESDPEVVELEAALAEARAVQDASAARVRESDHEREAHRTKLRSREKELMIGPIRNPTDLMQMSEEVKHMKARFVEEEDSEMRLMEDADAADEAVRAATAGLAESRLRSAAEDPALRAELEAWRAELSEVEAERDSVWGQVPAAGQTADRRKRTNPPGADGVNNQCAACHGTV